MPDSNTRSEIENDSETPRQERYRLQDEAAWRNEKMQQARMVLVNGGAIWFRNEHRTLESFLQNSDDDRLTDLINDNVDIFSAWKDGLLDAKASFAVNATLQWALAAYCDKL